MKTCSRSKLRLAKETLKTLTVSSLSAVGGGMLPLTPSGEATCPCVTSQACGSQFPICSNIGCA